MFWPRTNEPGAFWGLMGGLVVGLIRFAVEFSYNKPPCGAPQDNKPPEWWYQIIDSIHYLHFGILLWALTTVITISVSVLTEPIGKEHLYRLTFWSRHSTKVRKDIDGDKSEGTEKVNDENDEKTGSKTKLQLAMEAAEFLYEPTKWKTIVNANAVALMCITCFLWGFYA
jgi:sodium/glucose cotransporter 1/sodium/glucose cotransporter 9